MHLTPHPPKSKRHSACIASHHSPQLQCKCEACQEEAGPVGTSKVSLGMPPRIWQAVKTDCFELTVDGKKGFFGIYMDAASKLVSRTAFREVDLYEEKKLHYEPKQTDIISGFIEDWWQHYPRCEYILSDPGEY